MENVYSLLMFNALLLCVSVLHSPSSGITFVPFAILLSTRQEIPQKQATGFSYWLCVQWAVVRPVNHCVSSRPLWVQWTQS